MLIVIKKYKFFTRKTNFIKFIIKLGYINIDLKKLKLLLGDDRGINIYILVTKPVKLFSLTLYLFS